MKWQQMLQPHFYLQRQFIEFFNFIIIEVVWERKLNKIFSYNYFSSLILPAFLRLIKEVDKELNLIFKKSIPQEIEIINKKIKYNNCVTIGFAVIACATANLMCINSMIQSFFYDPSNYLMQNMVNKYFFYN